MEFIQHLGFLSLLEVMTTFSPLVAQEMQHYHRNKHASPFVKSFWHQLIVGRKKMKGDVVAHENGSSIQSWMEEEARAFKVLVEGMSE